MPIKTIGYAELLEHVIWAFDLYEPNNRNERLKEKRSFDGKQDLYVDQLKSRLIEDLCHHGHDSKPTEEGQNLISGLLDFSEAAASFVFSKALITSVDKDRVYKKYLKYIFCPILANYILVFKLSSDVLPSMIYLDKLLKSIQNNNIASAAKKLLLEIIDKPECENYRDDIVELIREIRPDRTQRRATISQKINIAKNTCNAFLEQESKVKKTKQTEEYKIRHLHPLNELEKAYSICSAMLYFDIKTGLGAYLARQYKKYDSVFIDDFRVKSFAGDILFTILNKKINGNHLTSDIKKSIERLWIRALKDIPTIDDVRIKRIIETLYYLLGDRSQKTCRLTDLSKIKNLMQSIIANDKKKYLHPYMTTLQTLCLIRSGDLQEAKKFLEESIEMIANNSIGNIAYYASILLIGLKIKTNPKQIKNGSINPQIQTIINTQPLYTHMFLADGVRLGMKFESIISDHYSHTILRSIKTYNKIIYERLAPTDSEIEPEQAITDAWDGIEGALQKFDMGSFENPQEELNSIIQNTLSEADKKAILITYLPKSTLYNCIREFDGISSYLELSPDRHPVAYNALHVLELRKRLLKTIDPVQYELDTKDFTIPKVATVAINSNNSD